MSESKTFYFERLNVDLIRISGSPHCRFHGAINKLNELVTGRRLWRAEIEHDLMKRSGSKDQQRIRLLEALIPCTQEMLSCADKTDAREYVRLEMNLQSFLEEYKTLTGREYRVSER